MIHRAAPIVLAIALSPALVYAQDTALTVSVPSAEVHKGPSTVTPVVGHAARGTVLPVARNLGSWVRVPWPDAPDGVGYVHVTMGRIAAASTGGGAASAPRPQAAAPPSSTAPTPQTRAPIDPRLAARRPAASTPASHILGVGGLVGSPESIGATARAWSNRRIGVQFGLTHTSTTSSIAPERLSSMQFEPGVVYGLFDHVSDYVWLRPYVGSTMTVARQALTINAPGALQQAPETRIGVRVFAGSEFTFASLPRFALSADVGYRRLQDPIAGFDAAPLSLAVAGHWYVR